MSLELALGFVALWGGARPLDELRALPPEVAALSPDEQVVWIVRSIRDPVPPLADAVPFLSEAGSRAPDALILLLFTREVPALGDGESQTLSIYQRRLVHEALANVGRDVVMPAVQRALTAQDDARGHALAIEVLGVLGDREELEDVRLHAHATEGELEPRVAEALEEALAAILLRVPLAHEDLLQRWRSWSPEFLVPLVSALGRTRDWRGLDLLVEVMSWYPELAGRCLAQVRLVAAGAPREVGLRAAAAVRDFVDPREPQLCAAALLALGELEDASSIPTMIALLASSEDDGLAQNALWALRRISGLSLNGQASLWSRWYAQESQWHATAAQGTYARLGSPREHEVAAAMRELVQHRLHRHESARELEVVLRHDNPRFRAEACRVLGDLGSRAALPGLVHGLEDAEEDVTVAARAALVAIVGIDLGEDPRAWSDLE